MEGGEKVESFERGEFVQIGGAEGFEDLFVERGEAGLFGRGWRCTGGQLFGELVFALFVAAQDFTSAGDDGVREPSETRDFDAVGLVGAARLDAAEENDFAAGFANRDVDVLDAGKKLFELG